ncbi:MAG: glycosyltransferase family 10 [Luteolibacter sp.]
MRSEQVPTKPRKTVAFVDIGHDRGVPGLILDSFAPQYDFVEVCPSKADYVFHSGNGNGYDILRCPGVRIYHGGECVVPDFNISDYAMAFEHMDYADRNCWMPLLRMYPSAYASLTAARPDPDRLLAEKTDFCSYVVSNLDDSAPERIEIFEKLSAYKPVLSGGKWRNNVGGRVADKIAFQSKSRFVIAFENFSYPGYLTEKFAEAAQSNAVPIYWGDPLVASVFNPKAFVNCHDFPDLDAVVAEVRAIDSDETRYRSMLAEPWFPDGREPENLTAEFYGKFLANIFDQPHEQAYRRNRSRWGKKYEKRLTTMVFNPLLQFGLLAKERLRKLRGKRT